MVNPSHDFHPDEGEDEPMFGLPDLPQELSDNDDDDLVQQGVWAPTPGVM